MKIGICAIIKDEHLYLKEWLEHHLSCGFTHIYVFEDYGSKSHGDITNCYENVTLKSLKDVGIKDGRWNDGKSSRKQFELYEWALNNLKDELDWCAFIDVDEFFNFEGGWNLQRLCEENNDKEGLYLYWRIKTCSGNIYYDDRPVTERFKEDGECLKMDKAWTLKSFVNLNINKEPFHTIHEVKGLYNTMGMKSKYVICRRKAWLDHYFTKSFEEWSQRFLERGDIVWGHRKISEFFEINKNVHEDECWKFYVNKAFEKMFGKDYSTKKVLFIANEPCEKHIDESKYDIIIRSNRMTNYENTHTNRTDLWIFDASNIQFYYAEKNKDKFKQALNVLMLDNTKEIYNVAKLASDEAQKLFIGINAVDAKKYIDGATLEDGNRITTSVWIVILLTEYFKTNVTITALSFDDRSFLSNSCHKNVYKKEEKFLQGLINNKKISVL